MRNRLSASVPLTIVVLAAVAVVALRAATRRPAPRRALGTGPRPVTAAAADGRPRPAATAGLRHIAGQETAEPPGLPGRPHGSFEQRQYVFHELHAEGHHPLCDVCDY